MIKRLLQVLVFLFLTSVHAVAQNFTITGIVRDSEHNQGIPGVIISIEGTSVKTATDQSGRYSIQTPDGSKVLVFSYIGMLQYKTVIGDRTVLDVSMKTEQTQLSEVIVSAIGVKTEKDKFGSSVSTLKGMAVTGSGETTLLTGISSKVSGVLITRSGGDPGAGGYIQIRGQNTINGNAQPLFILDGMPVSNSSDNQGTAAGNGIIQQSRINDINPEDIESMEVLKGASAAALWGTRAANGVVIITTKKGKNSDGKVNITFKSTLSLDRINKLPGLQSTYGQGSLGFFNQGDKLSFGDLISGRTSGNDAYITNPTAAGYQGYTTLPDGSRRYAIAAGNATNSHGGKNSREVFDRYGDIFQTGHFLDNSISLSGGNDKSNIFISYSNLAQEGVIKAFSEYNRNAARVNASTKFNPWLSSSVNVGYTKVSSLRVQEGDNVDGLLLGTTRTPADFNNSLYQGLYTTVTGEIFQNAHLSYRNPLGKDLGTIYSNPVWNINNNRNSSDVDRLTGVVEFNITPLSWLSVTGRSGIDNYLDDRTERFARNSALFLNGYLSKNQILEKQFNSDIFASANKTFSEDFAGTLLMGVNYNSRRRAIRTDAISNLIVPTAPDILTNALNSNLSASNYSSLIRTYAYYMQADFEAYKMLFLTLSARSESASTFGAAANNSFFFPSAALAWQLTKIKGLDKLPFLNFAKLRLSWGQVGIQPQPYLNFTTFNPAVYSDTFTRGLSSVSALYGGGYVRSLTQGNDNLRPERKTESEIGIDLRMFNNRLNISATGYTNQTKDVILPLNVPSETGFTIRNTNAAVLSNKGLEIDINGDAIRLGHFRWNLSATFAMNRNLVKSLAGSSVYTLPDSYMQNASLIPGQPFGIFYSTDFLKDGNGKYILDKNGFPQAGISNEIIGNPNPKWQGGIGSTFSYKNISLYVLFDRVAGNDFFNGTRGSLYSIGTHIDQGQTAIAPQGGLKDVNGNTIAAGTSFQGHIKDFGGGPVAINQAWWQGRGSASNSASYKQFVEDASASRLREATLRYTIDTKSIKFLSKLASIDFSVTGRNLILWTNYTGTDPEVNISGAGLSRGQDWFTNPNTKSLLFSIQLKY
ncbi:SusC/RagA family TonB-linked outer membrane protein [Pedobacter aquatilis]|uniref:SusC/RagA family TonB-linked outer membrane protein n=1 Tax=Pedobacter aquatilis TaxID=351343 RepID=UPI00292E1452|nr:SusC/RagA family TonB-linked outer membrane protein [Pedobacter aquatilis]